MATEVEVPEAGHYQRTHGNGPQVRDKHFQVDSEKYSNDLLDFVLGELLRALREDTKANVCRHICTDSDRKNRFVVHQQKGLRRHIFAISVNFGVLARPRRATGDVQYV